MISEADKRPGGRHLAAVLVVLSVAAVGLYRYRSEAAPKLRVLRGTTMGTTYTVKVVGGRLATAELERLHTAVDDALEAVDARMSTYRADSELSQLNRHIASEPFVLSEATFAVLAAAQSVSETSGGAFDVTVGPLVDAWGFGPKRHKENKPKEEELSALRRRVGYQHLKLDTQARSVRKSIPAVACDLSAIAKGYAVDEVARLLQRRGITRFMVEVGGEVKARGKNTHGMPWQIAIERPNPHTRAIHEVVSLDDMAIATSGDYRNFYEEGGVRVSHTIDPRTGRPIAHGMASVSVLHPQAMLADAYATALNVLGPDAGFELAKKLSLAALLIARTPGREFTTRATSEFEQLLRVDSRVTTSAASKEP